MNEALCSVGCDFPKITVLMSVYNGQAYLRQAMDSILQQTFKNFEFLIINDGSTDASREIILSYQDARIRLIDNPSNIGLTRSLNRGLQMARGKWIARQDADDLSFPERLARQIGFVQAHPECAILGAQAEVIDADGGVIRTGFSVKPTTLLGIKWSVLFGSPFVHSSVLFRKDIIREELGGYNEAFKTNQDFELWSRLLFRYIGLNLEIPLVQTRRHHRNVSGNYPVHDIGMVRERIITNMCEILCWDHIPLNWVDVWIGVNNASVVSCPMAPKEAILSFDTIYRRFLELHPQAVGNEDLRKSAALIAMTVCRYYWKRSPTVAAQMLQRSLQRHIPTVLRIAGNSLRNTICCKG
ncbi:MAG: glycosyltransferase [Sedimentisphaerales bacterium]|nr:glycosyltransferase [Sedimentisphaerales bacterium]